MVRRLDRFVELGELGEFPGECNFACRSPEDVRMAVFGEPVSTRDPPGFIQLEDVFRDLDIREPIRGAGNRLETR